MIYLDETKKPLFTSRREQRALKARVEPVVQDATAVTIVCAVALVGVLILALIASPWMTAVLYRVPEWLPGAGAETVQLSDPESGLNVRQGPGREYRAVYQLADGAEVNVIETQDGWAHVGWTAGDGTVYALGWVSAEYLSK